MPRIPGALSSGSGRRLWHWPPCFSYQVWLRQPFFTVRDLLQSPEILRSDTEEFLPGRFPSLFFFFHVFSHWSSVGLSPQWSAKYPSRSTLRSLQVSCPRWFVKTSRPSDTTTAPVWTRCHDSAKASQAEDQFESTRMEVFGGKLGTTSEGFSTIQQVRIGETCMRTAWCDDVLSGLLLDVEMCQPHECTCMR